MSKRIALIIGTRPEAIKLGPVYQELRRRAAQFAPLVIATAQHRQMLDQMLPIFQMTPTVDLNLMQEGQTLSEVTSRAIQGLQKALENLRPDLVLVQGDTTTVLAGALAAFYNQIPVGHVEAGLRTGDKYSPFPEEINRKLTTALADLHFAATAGARQNLLREGIADKSIFVTGNPVIDALRQVAEHAPRPESTPAGSQLSTDQRLLLVTAHRRENLGQPLRNICRALRLIGSEFRDVQVLYAAHPNPRVRETVEQELTGAERVTLMEPPDYLVFVALMQRAHLILTDSGGVQEEAPGLGVPVLVMRDTSERPEGLACGSAELVGTDTERIVGAVRRLLTDEKEYQRRRQAPCPYGDGKAAQRIADALGYYFTLQTQPPADWEVPR